MEKDSFLMYAEWGKMVKKLSLDQAGTLLLAIFAYHTGESLPEMDDRTDMCFSCMQVHFDRNAERYSETCEKRRESGRLGGIANATKRKQMVANGSTRKQTIANQADNDNDNDNDHDNDDDYLRKKKERIAHLEERDRILEEDDYAERHEGAGEVYFKPKVKLGWAKPKEENGIPKPPLMSDEDYKRMMDRLTAFKERHA